MCSLCVSHIHYASPQSLFLIIVVRVVIIYITTNLQISAPSYLPIITSKQLFVFFFFQGSFPLNNKHFRQWSIILTSSSGIQWYSFANIKFYTQVVRFISNTIKPLFSFFISQHQDVLLVLG